MCDRTCPKCGSQKHFEQYGIQGLSITCGGCWLLLANRRDREAAPVDLRSDDEIDKWFAGGTFILPGAEATDPADDELFSPAKQTGEE